MLESFSKRLLPMVEYHLAPEGAMSVENETVDFYRYIDFTQIVEQFYDVVEHTLNHELLPELDYLAKWDLTCKRMMEIVDMLDRKVAQFILFVQQNHGSIPNGRRNLFSELSDDEINALAQVVRNTL